MVSNTFPSMKNGETSRKFLMCLITESLVVTIIAITTVSCDNIEDSSSSKGVFWKERFRCSENRENEKATLPL